MYKQILWLSISLLLCTQKAQAQSTNLFGGGGLSGAFYYGTLFSLPTMVPELNNPQQTSPNPPQFYSPDNSDATATYDLSNEDGDDIQKEYNEEEDCSCES